MKDEKEEEMLRKKLKPRSNYNTGLCTGSNFNGRGTWVAIRNRLHLNATIYTVKNCRKKNESKVEDLIRNPWHTRNLTSHYDFYGWLNGLWVDEWR